MSEAKFTKGEWYWMWDDCDCEYQCSHGKYATSLRSKISETEESKITTPVIYIAEDINSHDAHLIEMAPNMYDFILEQLDSMDSISRKEGEKILAKARGES